MARSAQQATIALQAVRLLMAVLWDILVGLVLRRRQRVPPDRTAPLPVLLRPLRAPPAITVLALPIQR